MATILVIDDEKDLVRLLRHNLEKSGYRVVSAPSAEAGLKKLRADAPDLLLLDIMLPGMDGLEFLRALRRESDVPVILLSAKGGELDRVLGLKLGADDYVVKPFSLVELQARVAARLRMPAAAKVGRTAAVGALRVDFARHEVKVKGRPVRLATKEFRVLELLLEADGKVLSRDALLERVWEHDAGLDLDTRTVDQHIARLRRKLGEAGAVIVTVPNFGYKLAR
ncbi:MAG: response regulator transcription factor [Elusimicrobiota bacterium]|nr:response regulator transcription factor [Elusimicrobiota bacterium]